MGRVRSATKTLGDSLTVATDGKSIIVRMPDGVQMVIPGERGTATFVLSQLGTWEYRCLGSEAQKVEVIAALVEPPPTGIIEAG